MKKIFFIGLLSLLLSCDDDVALRRSVFINDPDAPGLPKYSEWGYNTFGAFYNREVIVSNDYEIPVQVIQQFNETTFRFSGQRGDYYWESNSFQIELTIHDFTPGSYDDLLSLNGQVVDLSDAKYSLSLKEGETALNIELLNGTFEFKRAQRLLVDGEPQEVILSGVFEFQVKIDNEPVSISEGRFDVGIGSYNFFVYD